MSGSERKGRILLKQKKGRMRSHTNIRCPVNGLQATWCRMLCTPIDDLGICGRPAPHLLKGRTQQAIALYNARTD